ncbi:MAG: flagellar hook-basal body protein [Gaiellaceae bacterium]
MTTGIHSAAAGLLAHQARMDALANDIANVSTSGYKSTRIAFQELVGADGAGSGAASVELGRSLRPGTFVQSGDPLSVAIDGPGFLQVRRADGSAALTRSGELHVDSNGALVTASGERLEPPVTLPPGTSPGNVDIEINGEVSANGRAIGRIELVEVPAPSGLISAAGNLFLATESSGAPTASTSSTLLQGVVEGSNVDLGTAMVEMIAAQRGFQLSSRAVRTQDQLMEIANAIRR